MLDPLRRTLEIAARLAQDPVASAETGLSPHRIGHRQAQTCVRYFPPKAGSPARHPLFVSMPLINTWTVFDLRPGRSVIEELTAAGLPIYLMDWGRPGPEDTDLRFGDIVDDLLPRAMRRSARHARAEGTLDARTPMDALGYCVAGTVLAITLARHRELARRMALLAAPIDFHASGRLATWTSPGTFPVDAIVDGFGNFPRAMMRDSVTLLTSETGGARYKALFDRFDEPGFRALWAAMERGNEDSVDVPGETYAETIHRRCVDNAPVNGGWVLDGAPVDLTAGTLPAAAFGAQRDPICPPAAASGLARAWGGPVETVEIRGGHVGVCLGTSFARALLTWLDQPLPAES